MAYERVYWENFPSTATPRGATNLNRMDVGIEQAHELAGTVVHVAADYLASVGDHVVVDAAGFDAGDPLVVTLPDGPVDGATVKVSVTGTLELTPARAIGSGSMSIRVGAAVLPVLTLFAGTSTRFVYSDAAEAWDAFNDTNALNFGVAKIGVNSIDAEGDPDDRTFLRGDGTWAYIERNPVVVEAAYEATPGEDVYCLYGGYTITIPDGDQHGQIITVSTGANLLTGADVDVEFFNLTNQDTAVTTLPSTGARITLQWFQDIEFNSNTVSGWIPTTVATTDTAPVI